MKRFLEQKPPVYTFHLHPRDESGAKALSELNDHGINLVANALAQSADHILIKSSAQYQLTWAYVQSFV
jgi:hypothetical protein